MAFGEQVAGYDIPVLNEREIRASAGLYFLIIFLALMLILLRNDFLLAKYAITVFLMDFLIRVFISPVYAPSLVIGRFIVRNQVPEYVGAQQKKFAWLVGIILSLTMFIHLVILNAYSPVTGIICLLCLIFLFFESAFGICLGCTVYRMIYGQKAQYCPGEVCETRQPIQKTSAAQWFIVVSFGVCIILMSLLANDLFRKKPNALFSQPVSAQAK